MENEKERKKLRELKLKYDDLVAKIEEVKQEIEKLELGNAEINAKIYVSDYSLKKYEFQIKKGTETVKQLEKSIIEVDAKILRKLLTIEKFELYTQNNLPPLPSLTEKYQQEYGNIQIEKQQLQEELDGLEVQIETITAQNEVANGVGREKCKRKQEEVEEDMKRYEEQCNEIMNNAIIKSLVK